VSRTTLGWKLSLVATVLAVAGALAMLFLPLGRSVTYLRGPPENVVTRISLFEAEGGYAVAIAAIPVALAALTLPFRQGPAARVARAGSAGLLTIFFVLGLLTIGFFFIPAAVVMWVAAFVRR
jgi:putative intracellular protease/amidase